MFQALFCSSSGGTVRTVIGICLGVLCQLARHNAHKNTPIAVHVPPDSEQKSARNM
jgi:hypothetical protein